MLDKFSEKVKYQNRKCPSIVDTYSKDTLTLLHYPQGMY